MKRKRILYISDISIWAGSSHSLVNLISTLPQEYEPIVLFAGKGEVYDYMKGLGIECMVFKYVHNIAPFRWHIKTLIHCFVYLVEYYVFNKLCILYVSRKLRGKIDIVHSNSSAVPIGQEIARRIGAKHVWQIREYIDTFLDVIVLGGRNGLQKKIQASDSVICISNPIVHHWNLEGKDKVFVLWNAVRSVKDTVYIEQKEKYFLFCCGYLCDFKGADFATKCFCEANLFHDYKLKFVGRYSESYKEKLLEISRQYDAEGPLEFLGFQYEDEIKGIYAHATAFLQCSKIEGLGRTVIEAMFYGCPVIARNNGGTVDFVKDGLNGYLFETMEDCVEKMKYVAEESVVDIIKNAQRTAIDGFSIEGYGRKLEYIYAKVLS